MFRPSTFSFFGGFRSATRSLWFFFGYLSHSRFGIYLSFFIHKINFELHKYNNFLLCNNIVTHRELVSPTPPDLHLTTLDSAPTASYLLESYGLATSEKFLFPRICTFCSTLLQLISYKFCLLMDKDNKIYL